MLPIRRANRKEGRQENAALQRRHHPNLIVILSKMGLPRTCSGVLIVGRLILVSYPRREACLPSHYIVGLPSDTLDTMSDLLNSDNKRVQSPRTQQISSISQKADAAREWLQNAARFCSSQLDRGSHLGSRLLPVSLRGKESRMHLFSPISSSLDPVGLREAFTGSRHGSKANC